MNFGRLRNQAEVQALAGHPPRPSVLGRIWCEIQTRERQDAPYATGLRASADVTVWARYSSELVAGRYLRCGGRLLHIDSPRDPDGRRSALVLSCTELVGEAGEYRPAAGGVFPVRVFLRFGVAVVNAAARRTDYRTQVEMALLEAGRPQPGDRLTVHGVSYEIMGLVEDGDDGIVRRLWVKPQ